MVPACLARPGRLPARQWPWAARAPARSCSPPGGTCPPGGRFARLRSRRAHSGRGRTTSHASGSPRLPSCSGSRAWCPPCGPVRPGTGRAPRCSARSSAWCGRGGLTPDSQPSPTRLPAGRARSGPGWRMAPPILTLRTGHPAGLRGAAPRGSEGRPTTARARSPSRPPPSWPSEPPGAPEAHAESRPVRAPEPPAASPKVAGAGARAAVWAARRAAA